MDIRGLSRQSPDIGDGGGGHNSTGLQSVGPWLSPGFFVTAGLITVSG